MPISHLNYISLIFICFCASIPLHAQQITTANKPAQLDIRVAGANSIRITLKPVSFKENYPETPAVLGKNYPAPVISLREIKGPVKKKIGNFNIAVSSSPLSIAITNAKGEPIQHLVFGDDGNLSFHIGDQPVLGLGEGGPKPQRGTPWRSQAIQFDRRGALDSMQPRWQADAYGSRNPVAMLVSTSGWGLFVATPWVMVDMREKAR